MTSVTVMLVALAAAATTAKAQISGYAGYNLKIRAGANAQKQFFFKEGSNVQVRLTALQVPCSNAGNSYVGVYTSSTSARNAVQMGACRSTPDQRICGRAGELGESSQASLTWPAGAEFTVEICTSWQSNDEDYLGFKYMPDGGSAASATSAPTTTTAAAATNAPSVPSGSCGVSKMKLDGNVLAPKNTVQGIVGGHETSARGQIPYQVFFYASGGMCGGSIVNRNHIITAAHCIPKDWQSKKHDMFIVAGAHNIRGWFSGRPETGNQERKITNIEVHEQYEKSASTPMHGDIAILTLDADLEFNDDVQPICLPEADRQPGSYHTQGGHKLVVSGWGTTQEGGSTSSLLKYTVVDQVSLSSCKNSYGSRVDESMLCGSGEGTDSCQGDSGGPLAVYNGGKWELAGVVSFGIGCARADYAGVYANVPYFLSWIKARI